MRAVLLLACLAAAACNRVDPANEQAAAAVPVDASAASAHASASANSCNLESIDGTVVVDAAAVAPASRRFVVSGWLVDADAGTVPGDVEVRFHADGGEGAQARQALPLSLDRPDVQAANGGGAAFLRSGFRGEVDTSSLPAGRYAIRLAFARGDLDVVCDNGRAVVLD
jgi:hypothetical protein